MSACQGIGMWREGLSTAITSPAITGLRELFGGIKFCILSLLVVPQKHTCNKTA